MPTEQDLDIISRVSKLEEFKLNTQNQITWLTEHSATKSDVAHVASKLEDLETELSQHRDDTKKGFEGITRTLNNTNSFLGKISDKMVYFTGALFVVGVVGGFVVYVLSDILLKRLLG